MTDWNEPETEEDGIKAEALRRAKVRQLSAGQQSSTLRSPPSPMDKPVSLDEAPDYLLTTMGPGLLAQADNGQSSPARPSTKAARSRSTTSPTK